MVEAFEMGGGWMYSIALFGIVFVVLLVVQFIKGDRTDLIPVLTGLLAATALLGPLGTAVGISQAGFAVEASVQAEMAAAAMSKGLGVAVLTTVFSLIIAVPGAVALGIAARRARPAA